MGDDGKDCRALVSWLKYHHIYFKNSYKHSYFYELIGGSCVFIQLRRIMLELKKQI